MAAVVSTEAGAGAGGRGSLSGRAGARRANGGWRGRLSRLLGAAALTTTLLWPFALPRPVEADTLRFSGPPNSQIEAGDVLARVSWRYFDTMGHTVAEPFLTFFEVYGAFSSFGEPITDAFEEDGRLVQYFQRARLEEWPEYDLDGRVRVTLLGDYFGGPADPPLEPHEAPPTASYFPETGHTVSGDFLDFLGLRGGVRVFGYPTTEPYWDDGRLVQVFQGAILELWPEGVREQRVQPRLLGEWYAAERGHSLQTRLARAEPAGPSTTWTRWSAATEDATGYLPEKMRNVARAFSWLEGRVLEPGQTLNFARVLDLGGYELGLCYGAGGQYEWCSAGGACSGAGTFYRAWTNAGLGVVTRSPHTVLPGNPQLYGRDAMIYEGQTDLVVRNTSGTRLRLHASVTEEPPAFNVWIEGERGPDFTVTVDGPHRDGPFAFHVNYLRQWADGSSDEQTVTTRYFTPPPTFIPPKPGG